MPDTVGTVTADILMRLHGLDTEPHVVGTVELPLVAADLGAGVVQIAPSTINLAAFGRALADAVEAQPPVARLAPNAQAFIQAVRDAH